MSRLHYSLLRAAAAVPAIQLADTDANAQQILDLIREAEDRGVHLTVFPECSLTGYTCHDLFHQAAFLQAAERSLANLLRDLSGIHRGMAIVGLPTALDGMVFNAAAVIHAGRLLGVVPKSYLPNYREFYDARYFAPARCARSNVISLGGHTVPFGADLLFSCDDFILGVEICEDLWMPIPPSSCQAAHGATVLVNLSASNETVGKVTYRRQHVANQSRRCIAAYIYSSSGSGESTTDLVFGGHAMIAENGSMLAESARFQRPSHFTAADIDLDRLNHERRVSTTFNEVGTDHPRSYRHIRFQLDVPAFDGRLLRKVAAHPFVPADPATRDERCEEIFRTQTTALAQRLAHIGQPPVSIGVSGGLDSTLALLVLCRTMDQLRRPRSDIQALTMPGFGTSQRTLANARTLIKELGTTGREIDIRSLTIQQLQAMGHRPFGLPLETETVESFAAKLARLPAERRQDLIFENTQARLRTNLLMNSGFVVGTGDLSELALGWCTYNGDHMSMYNVNASIPKTLVRFLVSWAADHEFDGTVRAALHDVVQTVISPELLPPDHHGTHATESAIGPYELHDFFLYHLLRWGASPAKILFLAQHAQFQHRYERRELRHWLKLFLRRFFANQFKRSCLPDGPKVGTVSLSPRGDWRMPSDAKAAIWLKELESLGE